MNDLLRQLYEFDRWCDQMDIVCDGFVQTNGEQYAAKSDLKLSVADLRNSISICRKAFAELTIDDTQ